MTLSFADLELFYEDLADAITAHGPDREVLFLSRLSFLLADASPSVKVALDCLAAAKLSHDKQGAR